MADNTTINSGSGGDTIATDDLTTLNGGAVSGVKVQRVKVGFGSDAAHRDVDAANGLPVVQAPGPATGTRSAPNLTTTDGQILAADSTRKGAVVYNEGPAPALVGIGSTATSATSYSVSIPSGGYYEVPYGFAGEIRGITASSTAQLRVTAVT